MSGPDSEASPSSELNFADLQRLASEILGVKPEQVQLEVSLAKDLAADSLDTVELIMAVEDRYHVSLPEEELEGMKKVGDLWNFLIAHRAGSTQ